MGTQPQREHGGPPGAAQARGVGLQRQDKDQGRSLYPSRRGWGASPPGVQGAGPGANGRGEQAEKRGTRPGSVYAVKCGPALGTGSTGVVAGACCAGLQPGASPGRQGCPAGHWGW